jgi:hypothetical protein
MILRPTGASGTLAAITVIALEDWLNPAKFLA